MRWELISQFDEFLSKYGNESSSTEPRRGVRVLDLKVQAHLTFDDEELAKTNFWVDSKDIEEIVDYLQSGQRNNYETNEEIKALIQEFEKVKEWLDG